MPRVKAKLVEMSFLQIPEEIRKGSDEEVVPPPAKVPKMLAAPPLLSAGLRALLMGSMVVAHDEKLDTAAEREADMCDKLLELLALQGLTLEEAEAALAPIMVAHAS